MNVLSLFDGMSCGQQALERAGIEVNQYFASEIDKYAIKVTMANYPNTIQLGSVVNVNAQELPKIDLLIGGSPCQGFSFAGKQLAFDDPRSKLFFEFVRLKEELKPKYFLLENVRMAKKHENIITRFMGVEPIYINSALLSGQSRPRVYWTNINAYPSGLFGYLKCFIPQPKDKKILLKDILENNVSEKYYLSDKMLNVFSNIKPKWKGVFKPTTGNKKANCVTSRCYKMGVDDNYIVASRGRNPENPKSRKAGLITKQQLETRTDGKTNCLTSVQKDNLVIELNTKIRRLTPIECERLQTVKDNYTNYVSDSQRYKMLGNGWTVDVISYIFSFIK
jgi:DNA (cytosine-5)-methyltransferase 3A